MILLIAIEPIGTKTLSLPCIQASGGVQTSSHTYFFTVSTNGKSETSNFTLISQTPNIIQTEQIWKRCPRVVSTQDRILLPENRPSIIPQIITRTPSGPHQCLKHWCDTADLVYKYNSHLQEQQNDQEKRGFYTASEPIQETTYKTRTNLPSKIHQDSEGNLRL